MTFFFIRPILVIMRCGLLVSDEALAEEAGETDTSSQTATEHLHVRTDTPRLVSCSSSPMGVEWSAQNQEALEEIDKGLQKAESETTVASAGIQLFKFAYTDSSLASLQWSCVSANALPRFYDANEDSPSKAAQWRLEVEAGNIDAEVGHSLELLGDRRQRRVTFRCGDVWALKFPVERGYLDFWNDYNNHLFENIYGAINTRANREEHLGRDFASHLFEEEGKEPMQWEDAQEKIKQEEPTPNKSSQDAVTGEAEISLMKLGIGETSYLIRGDHVAAMRNVPCGVEDKETPFTLQKPDGEVVKPSLVMLSDREKKMGLLTGEGASSLLYADVETGKVVQEWKFDRDEAEIPMKEIVPETKNAPAEDRSTFLGYDSNRLCRWDMRDPSGIVQEYSAKLDWVGGKDYARNTNFTCMATTGDGAVVVGSNDGKIRLYSNKLTLKRASTAYPGIGTPITHVDVTYDGRWVIATTDHFIEVVKTTATDKQGTTVDGFRKSLGAAAAVPKLLKLKPEDSIRTQHAPLKNGRFTFVTEANHQERWIVATCGKFSVLWNFRQMKASKSEERSQGGLPTFTTYHLVSKDEPVVDSCFLHEACESGNQSEAALVVATSRKVWSFNE